MSTPEIEEPTVEPGAKLPETVPYHRLAETSDLLKASRKRARELEEEVTRLRPIGEQVGTLTKERDEWKGRYESDSVAWKEERAILGAGVLDDPDEAIDLARTFHRRLPEADRPALADWIKGLAAEGATVPKALQPYIRKPAAAVTTPAPKVAPPKVDSTGKAPPTASAVDPAQLAAARKEFMRTGDRAKYEAVLNAVKGAGKKT